MIAKNCAGKVPDAGRLHAPPTRRCSPPPTRMLAKARDAIERQAINRYLDAVWAVVGDANRYFAAEEPWAKRKTDFKRMETILYVTAEIVRQVAILRNRVMPGGRQALLDLLAQPDDARSFPALGEGGRLHQASLPAPIGVFPRYVDPGGGRHRPGAKAKTAKGQKREEAPRRTAA